MIYFLFLKGRDQKKSNKFSIIAAYLWFEASPYIGIGYKDGLAEGGHKTTATKDKKLKIKRI